MFLREEKEPKKTQEKDNVEEKVQVTHHQFFLCSIKILFFHISKSRI